MPQTLSVGGPWLDDPGPIPEGPHFTIRDMPELTLAFRGFRRYELGALRHDTLYFALATRGSIIFFLYHAPKAFPWSDAPFNVHLMNDEDRTLFLNTEVGERDHILSRALAVDPQRNRILAIRAFTLPPHFMRALVDLSREQFAKPFDISEYQQEVQRAYATCSPADLLKSAVVTARGGI